MKKLILCCLLVLQCAAGFAQGFTVNEFSAAITLHPEGYFYVVERYDVTFYQPKHGLIRNIITKYDFEDETGKISKRKIEISEIDVPGKKFKRGLNIEEKLGGILSIKIGDAQQLVSGKQQYEIRYRVDNALILEDSLAQFYWNVKPADWQADFERIDFHIQTPPGTILSPENTFVYAGATGDTTISQDFSLAYSGNSFSGSSLAGFNSLRGQSVTVLIKLPRSAIILPAVPSWLEKSLPWIGWIAFLFLVFGLVWLRYGRDEKVISATSYYPPEGMDPALAGYLMEDNYESRQLISLLPKWGAAGLIKLEEIPGRGWLQPEDLKITRLAGLPADSPPYERLIFDGLFSKTALAANLSELISEQVLKRFMGAASSTFTINATTEIDGVTAQHDGETVCMSQLRNTFFHTMNLAKEQLTKKAKGYYEITGEKARLLALVLTGILTLLLPPIFLFVFGIIASLVVFVACMTLFLLSFHLRKKNKSGTEALRALKGFHHFIKIADLDRIKTLLVTDPFYFEKTMSYALSFGLLDAWASRFDALQIPPPTWYASPAFGSTHGHLTMSRFARQFSGSMSAASSMMVSTPSRSGGGSSSMGSGSNSSGGGSSGGGFGGGGGSSW